MKFNMNSTNFWLRICGTIFGVIAVFHLLRIITSIEILIGGWPVPLWFNWMGLIATALLCLWLWKQSMNIKG